MTIPQEKWGFVFDFVLIQCLSSCSRHTRGELQGLQPDATPAIADFCLLLAYLSFSRPTLSGASLAFKQV